MLANKPQPAANALAEACQRDPSDLEARLSLASAQERLGERDAAIESYRLAGELAPKHVRTWLRLAELLLGRWAERSAEPPEAEEPVPAEGPPEGPAKAAGEVSPGDAAAAAAPAQRDRAEALEAFSKATAADPRDEEVVLTHARVLLEGPEGPKAARGVLGIFLRRVPQAAGAVRLLAQLEASAGDPRQALVRIVELLKRRDLPAELREHLEAEAALYAWLQAGAKTPAPPGMDAGADSIDLDRARLRLVLLLDLLPDEPRLLLALARAELRAGDLSQARAWLDQLALVLGSGGGAAGGGEVGDRLRADAAILAHVSARLLKSQIVPGVSPPDVFFGEEVALSQAERLAALTPWLPAAHRTHGRALARAGQFREAAKAFARGAQRASGAERDALTKAAESALADEQRQAEHKDL